MDDSGSASRGRRAESGADAREGESERGVPALPALAAEEGSRQRLHDSLALQYTTDEPAMLSEDVWGDSARAIPDDALQSGRDHDEDDGTTRSIAGLAIGATPLSALAPPTQPAAPHLFGAEAPLAGAAKAHSWATGQGRSPSSPAWESAEVSTRDQTAAKGTSDITKIHGEPTVDDHQRVKHEIFMSKMPSDADHLQTVAPKIRPAPFDPAPTHFHMLGSVSADVAPLISSTLVQHRADISFLPRLAKWRGKLYSYNAGVEFHVRLYIVPKALPRKVVAVEFLRRHGDRGLAADLFHGLKAAVSGSGRLVDPATPDFAPLSVPAMSRNIVPPSEAIRSAIHAMRVAADDDGENAEGSSGVGGSSAASADESVHNLVVMTKDTQPPDMRAEAVRQLVNVTLESDSPIDEIVPATLAELAESPDPTLRCCAATNINQLARNTAFRRPLVDAECVPKLASSALNSAPLDVEVQRQAMAAVAALGQNPDCAAKMRRCWTPELRDLADCIVSHDFQVKAAASKIRDILREADPA